MNSSYKPKIHFILPGGGVRGSFQAGFLYSLFTDYSDYFETIKIDGTSVGAINGISIASENYEELKKLWHNINSIEDLFDTWSNNSLFGTWISYYRGFFNNGLFNNNGIKNLLINNVLEKWKNKKIEEKKKFSCVAVNVNKANTLYIDGDDENIIDYITASASPWIISNPVKINNQLFTDGGLLETYPLKNVKKCNADLTVIVGYDQEHFNFIEADNSNLLEYLATLIDISRFNSNNTIKMREIISDENIIKLSNPMKVSFLEFNKENIQYGFLQGTEFAKSFFETYLNKQY